MQQDGRTEFRTSVEEMKVGERSEGGKQAQDGMRRPGLQCPGAAAAGGVSGPYEDQRDASLGRGRCAGPVRSAHTAPQPNTAREHLLLFVWAEHLAPLCTLRYFCTLDAFVEPSQVHASPQSLIR